MLESSVHTEINLKIILLVAMAALCHSHHPDAVEKAFVDNEIVPDILNSAPPKIVNVS